MHLYVHIPFCHRICPYCGFYKHTPGNLANRAFVDAILSEAETRSPLVAPPFRTIYFGGGTPSLLSPSLLARLCDGLRKRLDISEVEEWTLEANPATFDLSKAELMLELGITRISLGVQSFHPETLQTLGRDHTPKQASEAFSILRDAGFQNVSVDLMFSIPGQTQESWRSDLETAVALRPDHISAYNLTYEEDTEFLERHREGVLDSNEDRDADLFYEGIDFLESHGFGHYEISNYARPGFESKHNQAYWRGEDYLGLGPGAVSTVCGERWKTLPDTASYVRTTFDGGDVRVESESLTDEDLRLERLALQLRTREGIPASSVDASNPVESLIHQGLLRKEGTNLVLTREGKALADPIASALA